MKFEKCPACEDYGWFREAGDEGNTPRIHRCDPRWLVRTKNGWGKGPIDMEGEGTEVWGRDEQAAVERWAERDDAEGDYTIVRGNECEVYIVPADDPGATPKLFIVSGESVPSYHAQEVEAK